MRKGDFFKGIYRYKQLVAGLLVAVCAFGGLANVCMAKNSPTSYFLSNPAVLSDENMNAQQRATWWRVTFGSYPQAEVIPATEKYVAVDSSLLTGEDVVQSDAIYHALEMSTDWDEHNETLLNGIKYRRITIDDRVTLMNDSNGHDFWSPQTTYRYFQYQPIKWRILEINNNEALLLSDQVLDVSRYNEEDVVIDWSTSSLRSWLNGYDKTKNTYKEDYRDNNFLDDAFSEREQEAILKKTLPNAKNISYGIADSVSTTDKVFLLSEEDIYSSQLSYQHGFTMNGNLYDENRQCTSSMYAKAKGLSWSILSGYEGKHNWWLRSAGSDAYHAVSVNAMGWVNAIGTQNTATNVGVRMAIYLDVAETSYYSYIGTWCCNGQMTDAEGNVATVPPYVAPTPPIILSEPPSSMKPHDSGYPAQTEIPQETSSAGIVPSTGVAISALPTINVQMPNTAIPIPETSSPASVVPTTEATFSTQTCIPTEVMATEPPNQIVPEQTSNNASVTETMSTEPPTSNPIVSNSSAAPVTNQPLSTESPTGEPVATPLPAGTRFTHIKSKGIYRVKNSNLPAVTFLHGTNSKTKQLTIPSSVTYKGITYHVTTIQPNACKNYTSLKKVTVGSYVTHIGKKAFYGCRQLKRIIVKSKCLRQIGANALAKTPPTLMIKVPAGKKNLYRRLWRGKGNDSCII